MFRKYENDYNPKIDFKVINLLNPKHDVINNYFEKVKIFKYDTPYYSEQGRWFKKIKKVYFHLINNKILTIEDFELAAQEFECDIDYSKTIKVLLYYNATKDIPYNATWLLREIWKEKPIGKYSYVFAVLVMNSLLKKNNYIPMIFLDEYNNFINRLIDENITTESLYEILSIYRDMSIKYIDKFDLIDKKTVLQRINSNKDNLIKQYGVKTIWLFGSFVRDESTEYSDVDLYVEFYDEKTEEEYLIFETYMKSILKRRVDMHIEGKVYERFAPNGKESREVVFSAD